MADRIDDIVGKQAYDQLIQLEKQLDTIEKKLPKVAENFKKVAVSAEKSAKSGDQKKKIEDTKKLTLSQGEYAKQINQLNVVNEKLRVSEGNYNIALIKKRQELANTNKQIKENVRLSKAQRGSLVDIEVRLARLRQEFRNTAKPSRELVENIRRLDDQSKKLSRSIGQSQKNVGNYGSAFRNLGGSLLGFTGIVGGAILAIRGLFRAIKAGVATIKEFSAAQSTLASVLGKSKKDIEALEKSALSYGKSTQFTSTQVTSLQVELAKLGFTQEEILKTTGNVLDLAAATGSELADAAKVTGVALRAFNLDSSEAARVTSTLAVATTKSALSFADYETILATLGPVAKAYGFTLEDTVALTGKLKDAGFDASSAATATRNILLNLADANGDLAKSLGGSVSSFDELIPALAKLRDGGVSLNETLELTDKRSVAAFNTFLQSAESADTLRDSITGVNGELDDMIDTKLDNLEGDLKKLSSAWDGLILSFKNGENVIRSSVQFLTQALSDLSFQGQAVSDIESVTGKGFWGGLFFPGYKSLGDWYIGEVLQPLDEVKNSGDQKKLIEAIGSLKAQQQDLDDTTRVGKAKKRLLEIQISELSEIYKRAEKERLNQAEVDKSVVEQSKDNAEDEALALKKREEALRKYLESLRSLIADEQKLIQIQRGFAAFEIDNTEEELDKRIEAVDELLQVELKSAEKIYNAKIEIAKKTGEDTFLIEQEYQLQLLTLEETYSDRKVDVIKSEIQRRNDVYEKALQERDIQQQKEIISLQSALQDGAIGYEEYEKELTAIKEKYAQDRLFAEIKALENELDFLSQQGLDVTEARAKVNEKLIELNDLKNKRIIDSDKDAAAERERIERETAAAIQKLTGEIFNQFSEISKSNLDQRLSDLSKEREKIEEKTNRELELAEGNEDEQKRIRAEAERDKKKIEDAEKRARVQRAKDEKALALFEIAISTAKAIAKNAGNFVLMALAAATGAVQLATVASKPIPQFEKGGITPGGAVLVSEKGREGMILPSGKTAYTPESPSIIEPPKGTRIIPAHKVATHPAFQGGMQPSVYSSNFDDRRIVSAIKKRRSSSYNLTEKGIFEVTNYNNARVKRYKRRYR